MNFSSVRKSIETNACIVAAGFSVYINTAGAQIGIRTDNVFHVVAVWLIRGPWLPMIDWIKIHMVSNTRFIPTVITPYGLLWSMLFMLIMLWGPCLLFKKPFMSSSAKKEIRLAADAMTTEAAVARIN